jgi:hypothetical protein
MVDPNSLLPGDLRGYPSGHARMLVCLVGLALVAWGSHKARNRTVLVPTVTLILTIGAGIIAFAIYPAAFNSLSYVAGVYYPPVFYLLLAMASLLVVILHLAVRLAVVDERCRKLSQEIALLRAEGARARPLDGESRQGAK